MSKQQKIEGIKEIILSKEKPACYMSIFIYAGKEPRYYKKIPWERDIDISCADKATADELILLLTKLQNAASANPKITGIEYYEPI